MCLRAYHSRRSIFQELQIIPLTAEYTLVGVYYFDHMVNIVHWLNSVSALQHIERGMSQCTLYYIHASLYVRWRRTYHVIVHGCTQYNILYYNRRNWDILYYNTLTLGLVYYNTHIGSNVLQHTQLDYYNTYTLEYIGYYNTYTLGYIGYYNTHNWDIVYYDTHTIAT